MNITSREANTTYYMTEAYPSLKEPEPWIFVVTGIYLCCFIVGICGNASTLTIIFGFGSPKSPPKLGQTAHDRFKVYVACLCIVDTLMLLSLPSAIVDSLIGFWIFGSTFCKFHHVCSSVGRIASTLVITSLSIERYLAVVSPQKFGTRSSRTTGLIMFLLFTLASVLLLPLLIFAKADRVFLFESRQGAHIVHIRIYKCIDSMPTNLLFWFTGSTFFVGYLCPIVVITLFNAKLLLQIRRHQRKISVKSAIPMKRVTGYIMMIAIFYFVCWSPYWAGVVWVSLVDLFASHSTKTIINKSERTMFLLYLAHMLPYFNVAINWLLYGRLARNLTSQPSSSLVYRNGALETTSFTKNLVDNNTQSEFSWTRKHTTSENQCLYGGNAAPTQHITRSNTTPIDGMLKLADKTEDECARLTKYEEEIKNFESL